jgi:hypothetical protein
LRGTYTSTTSAATGYEVGEVDLKGYWCLPLHPLPSSFSPLFDSFALLSLLRVGLLKLIKKYKK